MYYQFIGLTEKFLAQWENRRFYFSKKKGQNGFGYDPIFIPFKRKLTFAEMRPKEKFKIDHRFNAFKKIKKFF